MYLITGEHLKYPHKWMESNSLPAKLALPTHSASSLINNPIQQSYLIDVFTASSITIFYYVLKGINPQLPSN